MPIPNDHINREAMLFHLREAAIHIEELCREIEAGEHDDSGAMVLRIDFDHILNHLCFAWHQKWMSEEDINGLTEEEDQLILRCVPNWSLESKMVDIDEPKQFDRRA